MKNPILFILLSFIASSVFAQSSSINWIATDGGNHDDFGTSVTCDDNYVYAAGVFNDTCTIGDTTLISYGARDVYITKYDKEGNFIWVKQFGGMDYDGCTQILHHKGHILMSGYFSSVGSKLEKQHRQQKQSGFILLDLDVDGNLNWAKGIEPSGTAAGYALTTDSQNNIFLSGYFEDTLSIGGFSCISNGGLDIFTVKLDTEGHVLWLDQAGGVGDDLCISNTSVCGYAPLPFLPCIFLK